MQVVLLHGRSLDRLSTTTTSYILFFVKISLKVEDTQLTDSIMLDRSSNAWSRIAESGQTSLVSCCQYDSMTSYNRYLSNYPAFAENFPDPTFVERMKVRTKTCDVLSIVVTYITLPADSGWRSANRSDRQEASHEHLERLPCTVQGRSLHASLCAVVG